MIRTAKKTACGPARESEADLLAICREQLAAYAVAHFPALQLPPFLSLVVSKLEAVKRGEIKRLILSMPPRHGKSLIASTYFPSSYLGTFPDRYVIGAS